MMSDCNSQSQSNNQSKEYPFVFDTYLRAELILRRNAYLMDIAQANCSVEQIGDREPAMKELKAELLRLGYRMTPTLMAQFETLSEIDFQNNATLLVHVLEQIKGDRNNFSCLHADFPRQKGSDVYQVKRLIAIFDTLFPDCNLARATADKGRVQLSCGCRFHPDLFDLDQFNACPVCQRQIEELGTSIEGKKQGSHEYAQSLNIVSPTVIDLANEGLDFEIFSNLLSSNNSISKSDIEFITQMVIHYRDEISAAIPSVIPFKEQLCLIQSLLMVHAPSLTPQLKACFKTATDVMRLAVFLSGGRVSLERVAQFKFRLSRKQRKEIMSLLGGIKSPLEDMSRRRGLFLALGKYLHVGVEAKRYPKVTSSYDILRNNPKSIHTFNRQKEQLIRQVKDKNEAQKSLNKLADLLASRPGEFVRSLDLLLREAVELGQEQIDQVLKTFSENVLSQIKLSHLLILKTYFKSRTSKRDFRSFVPKGDKANMMILEGDSRAIIPRDLTVSICHLLQEEIHERLCKRERLGKVYISSFLKNITLPLAMRSSSQGLKVYPRASRIPIEQECGVLRLYLYWKGNADFDLSAEAFCPDWKFLFSSSYWSSHNQSWATFSGDIQRAPKGAAECIDINIDEARRQNIRYICMFVNVYAGKSFDEYHAFVGVMESKDQLVGDAFEPSAAINRLDLTGASRGCMPLILDLETMEYIVSDINIPVSQYNNSYHLRDRLIRMAKALNEDSKNTPTLYELMEAHALARADIIVSDEELAGESQEFTDSIDHYFDADFAQKLDEINAHWLSD